MKNYYDELEVSQKASKEIIEKAYKVLAKKYHPDMNTGNDKIAAEEKFKKISEAYEILSNDEKRKKYDLELENSDKTVSYEEYLKIINERNNVATRLSNLQKAVDDYNKQLQNRQSTNNYRPTPNYTSTQNYSYSNRYHLSKFEILKQKIKKKIENLFIFILVIIVIFLMINAFTGYKILDLFLK